MLCIVFERRNQTTNRMKKKQHKWREIFVFEFWINRLTLWRACALLDESNFRSAPKFRARKSMRIACIEALSRFNKYNAHEKYVCVFRLVCAFSFFSFCAIVFVYSKWFFTFYAILCVYGWRANDKKKSCEREKSERWWWKQYITIRFPTECLHACMSVTEWVWGCAVSVNVFISFLFGIFIIFVCFSLLFSLFSPITSSIIIYFFCVYHLNICHKIYTYKRIFAKKYFSHSFRSSWRL